MNSFLIITIDAICDIRPRFYLLLFAAFLCGIPMTDAQDKELRIGYILDSSPDQGNLLFERIKNEVEILMGSEYDIPLEEKQVKSCAWNADVATSQLHDFLADSSIDLVIGVGTLISEVMSRHTSFSKPVLASIIIDAEMQNVKISDKGTSTIDNFSFILSPYSVQRDLDRFYEIFPYRNLAILLQEDLLKSIPTIQEHFRSYFNGREIEYTLIPVSETSDELLSVLDNGFDAVYIGPVFSLRNAEEFQKLISGINALKLPSFALVGSDACKAGVLATVASPSNLNRISRRIAIDIQQLMDGRKADELPVEVKQREQLYVNMETVRQIEYYPSWDLLSKAVLLNEEDESIDRSISLLAAIQEALENNLELQIGEQELLSGLQEIEISRSSLLPQLSVSNLSRVIDKDRAEASFGSAPEWYSSISGEVEQLILSEPARANREISKEQQNIRIHAQTSLEMDIIAETAEAYLNVLRAKTFLRIQRENLSLSRKNLEIALIRKEVGYSGPSDSYRWESSIAMARTEVLQAEADMRKAEMHLNQKLNRPISELFKTEEVSLADNYIITNDQRLFPYIGAADIFAKFSDFMVEEGFRNLPEIKQLDAGIRVNARSLLMRSRSLYTPSIGMFSSVDQIYLKEGAGTGSETIIPGLTPSNDLLWTIGIQASLPIYTGGGRTASIEKSRIQLDRTKFEKLHFQQIFEQRIRNELEETAASFTSIDLSFEARDASNKNLALVQDSYSKGLVSVIQLIDAQNASIQAQLGAANAIYEFVLDLIRLERAVGNYYTLSGKSERDAYFQRLEDFIISK